MTIQTHTDNRKAMVEAIAQRLGQERQYAGAPSFNYTIGSIMVAKDGSITGGDEDLRALLPFLMERGYIDADTPQALSDENADAQQTAEETEAAPIQEQLSDDSDADDSGADERLNEDETDAKPTRESSDSSEDSDLQVSECIVKLGEISLTPLAATNLLFSLYTEQYLLNRAFGEETLTIPDSLVTQIQERTISTMDEFLSITDKAVESGELRGVEFGVGTFAMTFPADAAEPDSREVYVQLMRQLIKFAITATRVMPKLLKPESEKYYLHSWLLRLGCGGSDFKALRKRLLSGLDGYCAFPDEERAQRHKNRYKEIRRKTREGSNGSDASQGTVNSKPDESSGADETNEEAEAV